MADEAGVLTVGIDPETNEVVVNVPECPIIEGFWHITFSPDQARQFAMLLITKAGDIEASKNAGT